MHSALLQGDARADVELLGGLEPVAVMATRAAALACQSWVGRGNGMEADGAATAAMRAALSRAPGMGTVVVGEGAKDKAPMLFDGEQLGADARFRFDIAVDPLECTNLCARGLPGSLATIALAGPGTMASLAAAHYMEKLVGPPALCSVLDLAVSPETNLQRAGEALDRPVSELRVVVLDKPRHASLIERLHRARARVITPPDGDVAGALAALLPVGEADLLMGIGGTPEGVMTACAVAALGGFMQVRLAPQRPQEARAAAAARLSTERIYELHELVSGESLFAATGVTGGTLLRAPWQQGGHTCTESIVIRAGTVRHVIDASVRSPAAARDVMSAIRIGRQ
ncbi:MAG: fructose-bisphosphatase class II family protein [Actinomycetota bacterium]|nr:fructose-bisphosphatase class II family protein [Actinomycetota bacterium]